MRPNRRKKIAVVGAGAAGFFAAVNTARLNKTLVVTIFEKSRNLLSKVRVSGGGRCNVTNFCFDPEEFSKAYPRGSKMMRWNFEEFQARDTVKWFEKRGVKLKAEADGRMFPVTDSSETVIECLLQEANMFKVAVRTKTPVNRIEPIQTGGYLLHLSGDESEFADIVVIASGGSNRLRAYDWIAALGHTINPPVPSLFTFNFREKVLTDLAGVSVQHALIEIQGTRFSEAGPVLITHWGLSGPAVLKLSARAARLLHQKEYRYNVRINWIYPFKEEDVRKKLILMRDQNPGRQIARQEEFDIPVRLWKRLLELAEINPGKRWAELSNKDLSELVNKLIRGSFACQGKTTYKEEFVTCGGVALNEVDPATLESKKNPGLYFVGEVLDIDGITGGFNFQAAWTNGWLAAKAIALDGVIDVS